MILDLIFSSAIIAGIASLWRNFRYDTDNPANAYLNKLPYFLKKPITCGLCVTFWIAFFFSIFFIPLGEWLPPTRFFFSDTVEVLVTFFTSWMIVGTGAALILYFLDTLFEISHFYKHTAHTLHEHE